MGRSDVKLLRSEYEALVMVADGLLGIVRAGAACNTLTMAQMAAEARSAARKLAQLIEGLCRGPAAVLGRLAASVSAWVASLCHSIAGISSY